MDFPPTHTGTFSFFKINPNAFYKSESKCILMLPKFSIKWLMVEIEVNVSLLLQYEILEELVTFAVYRTVNANSRLVV